MRYKLYAQASASRAALRALIDTRLFHSTVEHNHPDTPQPLVPSITPSTTTPIKDDHDTQEMPNHVRPPDTSFANTAPLHPPTLASSLAFQVLVLGTFNGCCRRVRMGITGICSDSLVKECITRVLQNVFSSHTDSPNLLRLNGLFKIPSDHHGRRRKPR